MSRGPHGKLDLFEVERVVTSRSDIHYPKPRVISLTQATESGTIYRVEAIQALAQLAEKYRLHVHMDGARLMCSWKTADADIAALVGDLRAVAGLGPA